MSVRYIFIVLTFALVFVWVGRYLEIGGDTVFAVGAGDEEYIYESNYSVWASNENNYAGAANKLTLLINDLNANMELEVAGRQATNEHGRAGNHEAQLYSDRTAYGSTTTGALKEYNSYKGFSTGMLFEHCCESEGHGYGVEDARGGETAEQSSRWFETGDHLGEFPHESGEPAIPTLEIIR